KCQHGNCMFLADTPDMLTLHVHKTGSCGCPKRFFTLNSIYDPVGCASLGGMHAITATLKKILGFCPENQRGCVCSQNEITRLKFFRQRSRKPRQQKNPRTRCLKISFEVLCGSRSHS